MAIINITNEMIEAGKPWETGWQKATVVDILEESSSKKDSINYMPILEWGWSSDGSNIPGKQLSKYAALMNNKNSGMFAQNFLPFVAACTGQVVNQTLSVDTERLKGAEVWVEIQHEIYQGRPQNKVVGWADRTKVPF